MSLCLTLAGPSTQEGAAAAPVFQAAGTAAMSVTTISPEWPAHQADDIALLLIESTGGQPVTLTDPQGFAEVTNSPQDATGATVSTRLHVFWCRATSSSMTAPTTSDPGNHVVGQIVTFRGCVTTGNPWDVTVGDALTVDDTAVSVPGTSTTVANCLVVAICSTGSDFESTTEFSGWTNSNLVSVTEIADVTSGLGNGGGFGAACGVKASAGDYGATTATALNSSGQARLSIALKG